MKFQAHIRRESFYKSHKVGIVFWVNEIPAFLLLGTFFVLKRKAGKLYLYRLILLGDGLSSKEGDP